MEISEAIEKALNDADRTDRPPGNESATRYRVIDPLLEALGYSRTDVEPEAADSAGQYPDYAILPNTPFTWYIEAKQWRTSLDDKHAQQALNYANQNGSRWVVLTNGMTWRLYDNYVQGQAHRKLVADVALTDTTE